MDKPLVKIRRNDDVKYTNIVTTAPDTKGYGSNFILIKAPDQLWGFHVIWMRVCGSLHSAISAFPVKLGKHKIADFGHVFLMTFELVLERITGVKHILGQTKDMSSVDTADTLVRMTYEKMWDLDVEIIELAKIPKDVRDDFKLICKQEYEGKTLEGD